MRPSARAVAPVERGSEYQMHAPLSSADL